LALILNGVIVWIYAFANGTIGIAFTPTSPQSVTGMATRTPFVDRVTVFPASPAYRAGLRTGDLVDLRPLSAADRYRWSVGIWRVGERIDVPVVRADGIHRVAIAAESTPFTWHLCLAIIGGIWLLLFAALIAWRRAESAEARTLALLLIAFNLGSSLAPQNWITSWAGLDAVVGVLGQPLFNTGIALFATYAMLFARPPTLLRRILLWLSYATVGTETLYAIAYGAGVWSLAADPTQAWFSGSLSQVVTGFFPGLFPLLCAIATVAQARGSERARFAWASASLGLLLLGFTVSGALIAFDPSFSSSAYVTTEDTIYFIAPIGLTYSLLSRRLLDIGFAINRAAVFSGVSIIVVGTFVLAEWAVSAWFSDVSHTTNVVIGAALALALGLSVRAIHSRVDRVLDTLFFRKRHEDEQAIRTFAHEAAYITDAPTLLNRAVATLERHADATFVTLALDDRAGRYGEVNENDPAIVALRAGRKIVDLHTMQTDLRGEFAYPMNARGRLVGALVIGPKRSGDAYAPDESDAIAQLAHRVGDTLAALSSKTDDSRAMLPEAIQALTKTTTTLSALIERLLAREAPL
jgi:hypothetical protein